LEDLRLLRPGGLAMTQKRQFAFVNPYEIFLYGRAFFGYNIYLTKFRRQKTEDRRQKTEDRRQKTEDRRQKTEDRRQKTEDRRQKTEDRGQTTEASLEPVRLRSEPALNAVERVDSAEGTDDRSQNR
jgi:hypothetical protein